MFNADQINDKTHWNGYEQANPNKLDAITSSVPWELKEFERTAAATAAVKDAATDPMLYNTYQTINNIVKAMETFISPEEIYSRRINSQMPLSPFIDNLMKDSAYSSYHPYLS